MLMPHVHYAIDVAGLRVFRWIEPRDRENLSVASYKNLDALRRSRHTAQTNRGGWNHVRLHIRDELLYRGLIK